MDQVKLPSPPTMTPAEKEAQRRSFAYGNVAMHNPDITKEDIDKAANTIPKESE